MTWEDHKMRVTWDFDKGYRGLLQGTLTVPVFARKDCGNTTKIQPWYLPCTNSLAKRYARGPREAIVALVTLGMPSLL
jgi:hypothetical protein